MLNLQRIPLGKKIPRKSFVKFFWSFKLESDFFPHFLSKIRKLENSAHLFILNYNWANFQRNRGQKNSSLHFTFTFTSLHFTFTFTSLTIDFGESVLVPRCRRLTFVGSTPYGLPQASTINFSRVDPSRPPLASTINFFAIRTVNRIFSIFFSMYYLIKSSTFKHECWTLKSVVIKIWSEITLCKTKVVWVLNLGQESGWVLHFQKYLIQYKVSIFCV